MLQKYDERNRDLMVNVNGELVHRDKAGVSPFDSAVQGGDAVWEGLRLYNGRIFKLLEHLDRLERSARALSFSEIPPHEKIIDEIKRTLAANKMWDSVHIRLTLTRGVKITSGMDPRLNQSGPTLIVLAEHKAPVYVKTGLTLITSKIRRPPPEIRIVAASRITWQFVTTIAGPTVTPLPTESPPCRRSASTRTTLLDTETNVAGCSTCAKAHGTNSSAARMIVRDEKRAREAKSVVSIRSDRRARRPMEQHTRAESP